jgi:hypothetical protein
MVAWRNVALAALVMVVAKPLVASAKTIDEEPDIMCEQDGGWAELSPLGLEGASAFNVSNVTDTNWGELAVMDLVLYVDVAEIVLPNGMLVRVITADYVAFELDLSLEGLMDVQQSLWEIVIGNLLGTLICCVASGILIALEKEFKCIGGTELHDMIDKQHQLHDDLHHATVFLEQVQNNPDSLTGKGRALALGYQQLLANAEFGQLKDTVRLPPHPCSPFHGAQLSLSHLCVACVDLFCRWRARPANLRAPPKQSCMTPAPRRPSRRQSITPMIRQARRRSTHKRPAKWAKASCSTRRTRPASLRRALEAGCSNATPRIRSS